MTLHGRWKALPLVIVAVFCVISGTSSDPVMSLLEQIIIGPLPDMCLQVPFLKSEEVCLEQIVCSVASLGGVESAHSRSDTVT